MANGEFTPADSDGFNEWDDSIAEEQQQGVQIPEVYSDPYREDKIDGRIATGILVILLAAKGLHSWTKHRNKE